MGLVDSSGTESLSGKREEEEEEKRRRKFGVIKGIFWESELAARIIVRMRPCNVK